jgi:c-di-GMP-binding flagellar brake protein YcgR
MPAAAAETILRDSIARNVAILLSLPSSTSGEAQRSRLLSEEAGGKGVWIESLPDQASTIELLRTSRSSIAVSFRNGEHVVLFSASVLRQEPAFRLSPDVTVDAILLAWPTDLRLTQRRGGYRVKLPLDAPLKARVWRAPYGTENWGPEIRAELRDLSVGGMGLILRPAAADVPVPKVDHGDRLKVELAVPKRETLVLPGRLRQPPQMLHDGSVRVGIDFDSVDATIEGRRALGQVSGLVAELQRTHARRRRAG